MINPIITLDKLTVTHPVKKFPALDETRRFITVITTSHRMSLSSATSVQFMSSCSSFKVNYNITPHLRLGVPSGFLPAFPQNPVCTARPPRPSLFPHPSDTWCASRNETYSTHVSTMAQRSQYIQNPNEHLDKHVKHVTPCALLHVVLILSDKYRLRLPAAISTRGWQVRLSGSRKDKRADRKSQPTDIT